MILENQAEFTRCKITRWHNWGYEGQGVKVAVIDTDCKDDGTMSDWCCFPLGQASEGGHGISVAKVLHEVAPKAEIHLFSYLDGDDKKRAEIIDYVIGNDYDLVNVSLSVNDGKNEPIRLLEHGDLPVVAASGNGGNENRLCFPASADWTIAVGALQQSIDKVAPFSNGGENLDCLGYSFINYLNSKGKSVSFSGTSCAAPFVTGMIALWMSWCKMIGYQPGREAVKQFVRKHCIDYGAEGKDKASGYGLLVLPGKLTPAKITMEIGSKTAIVNGKEVQIDVAPYVKQDRTMVPLRFVAEALGAEVNYIPKGQKIEIVL